MKSNTWASESILHVKYFVELWGNRLVQPCGFKLVRQTVREGDILRQGALIGSAGSPLNLQGSLSPDVSTTRRTRVRGLPLILLSYIFFFHLLSSEEPNNNIEADLKIPFVRALQNDFGLGREVGNI
jgi:hypothetical protein